MTHEERKAQIAAIEAAARGEAQRRRAAHAAMTPEQRTAAYRAAAARIASELMPE